MKPSHMSMPFKRGDSTSSDYSVAKTQEDNFVRVQIYKKCSKFYYFRGKY